MSWADLTIEQKELARKKDLVNGCGPSNWRGLPPSFIYTADCEEHDWNYAIGNTEEDRRWYDYGFYSAMVKDTRRLPWWQRPFGRVLAFKFYLLVRLFGKSRFNYGKKLTDSEILDSPT